MGGRLLGEEGVDGDLLICLYLSPFACLRMFLAVCQSLSLSLISVSSRFWDWGTLTQLLSSVPPTPTCPLCPGQGQTSQWAGFSGRGGGGVGVGGGGGEW